MATCTVDMLGNKPQGFGYSLGAGIAFDLGVRRPELVRKLVLATVNYNNDGFHPGLLEGISQTTPEMLAGTPWEKEYKRVAPNPDDWARLIEKNKAMDADLPEFAPEVVQSLEAPTLLIIGDSDIIRPEHSVELFRLLGGGVPGDMAGLPKSQLAILPGTTYVTLVSQAEMLLAMIPPFLDAPMPD